MSQFCTQCGTENVNDAKFCKSCGHSLIEQQANTSSERSEVHTEPAREQEPIVKTETEASSAENAVELASSWSGWLLLIPVLTWVLYRLGVLAGGNIGLMFGFMMIPNVVAEALGGALFIVGVPLIITTIIFAVKKLQDKSYSNFVKHTFIASILMLAFGIAANINTIRDEQKATAVETTSNDVVLVTKTEAIPATTEVPEYLTEAPAEKTQVNAVAIKKIAPQSSTKYELEPFSANLVSDNGRKYLKIAISLEMKGEGFSSEFDEKKPIFRDIIIRILSSKSLEEISTVKGKEKLKEEIVGQINPRLKDGKVINIYFTDFRVE